MARRKAESVAVAVLEKPLALPSIQYSKLSNLVDGLNKGVSFKHLFADCFQQHVDSTGKEILNDMYSCLISAKQDRYVEAIFCADSPYRLLSDLATIAPIKSTSIQRIHLNPKFLIYSVIVIFENKQQAKFLTCFACI